MTQLALIPFLFIAFAIAWGIIAPYIFLTEPTQVHHLQR